MTIKHMRILVEVCKKNSMTLAAQSLYMSQPAVSLAIREMEEYYGVKLFERISRKLYLTEAGERVYQYASHIVALFEDLETQIKNWDNIGGIRVGASMTVGVHFMPDLIEKFHEKYPGIETKVTVNSSDVLEEKILQNELDFAVIEGPVHSENLISETIHEEALCLICGKNHPFARKKTVKINDLMGQHLLLREKNSGTRQVVDSVFLIHGLNIEPYWESTSTLALIHAVSRGIGISIVPGQFVTSLEKEYPVVILQTEGMSFERNFNVVYHKNKFLSASSIYFIQLTKDFFVRKKVQ